MIGIKHDANKIRWHLLPFSVVEEIVKVLMFGADKYGVNNWQEVENHRDRLFSALIRHLVAWKNGETKDQESGLSHLAHAGCNIVFLLWFEIKGGVKNGQRN